MEDDRHRGKPKENTTTKTIRLVMLSLCSGMATRAFASSGASFGGPVGATDTNNAYPPPPGTFFGGYGNVLGLGGHAYDNEQREAPAPVTIDVNALHFGYVYPFKIAGGSLASGLQGSVFGERAPAPSGNGSPEPTA